MDKAETTRRHFGLIKTKLAALEPDSKKVDRNHLVQAILAENNSANVISITGTAGSGKSILMGQLHHRISTANIATCWLSLEREDDELCAFLSYFTAALSRIESELGERAFQMIDTNFVGEPATIFRTICEDISHVAAPAYIFLDDFQHITDHSIIAGVENFLAALPDSVHIVIASRAEIPFALSKRKIAGTLMEVDQTHLNFSFEETEAMLENNNHLSLEREEVQSLVNTTEGWAAGLQLAAIALNREPNSAADLVNNFSGTNQNLTSYLMESVFQKQSSVVQEFLLSTAPLARMNSDVCGVISGQHDVIETLKYLQTNNLFLISLDSDETWFRYHHLFAEFLIAQLKKNEPRRYQEICGQASDWFQSQGLNTEAVQYLLSAEIYTEAADLIVQKALEVGQHSGDHRTILDWIRRLPQRYHDHHPLIKLNYAWSLMFTRSGIEAQNIAQQVREQVENQPLSKWNLSEKEVNDILCLADVVESISYASIDKSEKARNFTENAICKWTDASNLQKAALNNSLAYCCIVNLEFDKGLKAAEKARRFALQSNAYYPTVWADWISAILSIKMGRLGEAETHLLRGREQASRFMGAQSHANNLISILLAEVSCDRGDYDSAQRNLDESPAFATHIGSMEPRLILYKTGARILAASGKTKTAIDLLRDGQELGLTSETPRVSVFLAAEEVKLLLRDGAIENAIAVGTRWGFIGENNIMGVEHNREVSLMLQRQMKARLLLGQGHCGKSIAVITDLINRTKAQQRERSLIELTVLKAIGFWHIGRESEALRTIATATELAAPEHFASPFLEADKVTAQMLETIVEQRSRSQLGYLTKTVNFERHLVRLLRGEESNPLEGLNSEKDDIIVEKLTKRETEILDLLAAGLSNGQLADTLLVSIATIKWHLHNIFEKLDVRNRTAAIACARRLDLIK